MVEDVAVHIAARVLVLAQGGEVLLSNSEHRGVHALKGVPDRWHVLAVV